ncbi:MAG: TAXI family TRAP transporter solute-binding subunit [Pseudomonadota bacterium]|nr:TAXI family TRAP transporter solute-binding subunit [Pseudomonadota bacterium]
MSTLRTQGVSRKLLSLVAAIVLLGAAATAAGADFITIGTGGVKGVYYALGKWICRMVNEEVEDLACTAESTAGSLYNLNAIRAGNLDFGIVQSDAEYKAYKGIGGFQGQWPQQDLRAVFAAHDEPFTVVARRAANIRTFDDLQGKRVNIGNPGSGQRATMEVLMAARGWTRRSFRLVAELDSSEQGRALCEKRVDAIVFTAGHPNDAIHEAVFCGGVLVNVAGPEVDRLVAENPYYEKAVIPGGTYRDNPDDIQTFSVKALFVTSAKVPDDIVYDVTKAVFENLIGLRRLRPVFARLTDEAMAQTGSGAPLHPGAVEYYRDIGLLEPPPEAGPAAESEAEPAGQ